MNLKQFLIVATSMLATLLCASALAQERNQIMQLAKLKIDPATG